MATAGDFSASGSSSEGQSPTTRSPTAEEELFQAQGSSDDEAEGLNVAPSDGSDEEEGEYEEDEEEYESEEETQAQEVDQRVALMGANEEDTESLKVVHDAMWEAYPQDHSLLKDLRGLMEILVPGTALSCYPYLILIAQVSLLSCLPGCQGLALLTIMHRLCMCLMVAPKRTPALLLAAFREWVGHSGVQEGFREKLENQFPDLYERFDEEYFANPLTEAWFLELERQTKRTFRDPGGYFDCYESGQRRAESLLADGYQPWDLLPLAEKCFEGAPAMRDLLTRAGEKAAQLGQTGVHAAMFDVAVLLTNCEGVHVKSILKLHGSLSVISWGPLPGGSPHPQTCDPWPLCPLAGPSDLHFQGGRRQPGTGGLRRSVRAPQRGSFHALLDQITPLPTGMYHRPATV